MDNNDPECEKELRVKARKDRKDRPFYNLLHKRPMQYTNTARGNSGALWVGGKSPGSGLPSYLFI